MAINPSTRYVGMIDNTDPTMPFGKAQNVTNAGDGTGTPWEADLTNDSLGWKQAVLDEAGVVPSGLPEKVGESQYLDGLKKLLRDPFDSVAELTGSSKRALALQAGGRVGRYYYTHGDAGYAEGIVKSLGQAGLDGTTIDGYYNVLLANGNVWVGDKTPELNVLMYGAKNDLSEDATARINAAITGAYNGVGKLRIPAGEYLILGKLSANSSNVHIFGDGIDVTILRASGTLKTLFEVNNGSWDEDEGVYALTGSSIGGVKLENVTLNGYDSVGCTGLVFARATLGCAANSVKITGFEAGARLYGSWYSKYNQTIFENCNVNTLMGYEANDMTFTGCDWVSNPANQSLSHIEIGGGTSRNINFLGCGLDGLPTQFGVRARGVHSLNFYGCYLEVYNDEVVKTANFFEFGFNTIGVVIDGCNLITGTGYSGTWVKCGIANGDAGSYIDFRTNFQLNGDTNTCKVVDTEHSSFVSFGNSRTEKEIIILDANAVLPKSHNTAFIPATVGTDEYTIPIARIKCAYTTPVLMIRVTFLESGTTLTGQKLRVLDDLNTVLINWEMPNNITAGDVHYLTDDSGSNYETLTNEPAINSQLAIGANLRAYTYKVGASQDFPAMHVEVELL